jgi:endonuclease/exonuclease/phosphatase family metal-dependent hydrolase
MYYMPDVVGIQETNAGWHNALGDLLVETGMYAPACQKNNAKSYNMTTMLYNTQTVKLVEEFVIDLDKNSDIRVFAVAIFEKLSDGKRFIVTNTHPAPTGQAENYARNFADMMRISTEQMEKYKDIPVIQTGDFNTKEQSAMYKTYMESTNLKDAKYEADVLVRDYCTYSGFGNAPKPGNASCIDHIFVNSKVDVKLFNVVIDHDVAHTSDHIPIYADIALK